MAIAAAGGGGAGGGVIAARAVLPVTDAVGMVGLPSSAHWHSRAKADGCGGMMLLAAVTGLAGGRLRDVILGRLPLFWLRAPELLATTMAGAVFVVAG